MYCSMCGKEVKEGSKFCKSCGNLIESDLKEEIPISGDKFIPNVYAGFWRRVLAYLIDWAIVSICASIIAFALVFVLAFYMASVGIDIENENQNVQLLYFALGSFIGLIANWLYYTLFESSSKQGTPGKMAIGIIVTDLNGRKISFGKANGRFWGKIISGIILGIGFIMAGTTQKKQALHDIMAGTLVVMKLNCERYNSILPAGKSSCPQYGHYNETINREQRSQGGLVKSWNPLDKLSLIGGILLSMSSLFFIFHDMYILGYLRGLINPVDLVRLVGLVLGLFVVYFSFKRHPKTILISFIASVLGFLCLIVFLPISDFIFIYIGIKHHNIIRLSIFGGSYFLLITADICLLISALRSGFNKKIVFITLIILTVLAVVTTGYFVKEFPVVKESVDRGYNEAHNEIERTPPVSVPPPPEPAPSLNPAPSPETMDVVEGGMISVFVGTVEKGTEFTVIHSGAVEWKPLYFKNDSEIAKRILNECSDGSTCEVKGITVWDGKYKDDVLRKNWRRAPELPKYVSISELVNLREVRKITLDELPTISTNTGNAVAKAIGGSLEVGEKRSIINWGKKPDNWTPNFFDNNSPTGKRILSVCKNGENCDIEGYFVPLINKPLGAKDAFEILSVTSTRYFPPSKKTDDGEIEGRLEIKGSRGIIHYIGAESGDHVPYCFKIESSVGRKILESCNKGDFCKVNGSYEELDTLHPDFDGVSLSTAYDIISVKSVTKLMTK